MDNGRSDRKLTRSGPVTSPARPYVSPQPRKGWLLSITTVELTVRLTKRGEYALRALIDLGIAEQAGRPLVQIPELAERECIPIKFLEAILIELKEAGYLESQRGPHGGYRLGRPMDQIKIGAVIRRIDGPLAPIGCVSENFYTRCSCPDEEHCGLRMLMQDVRDAIANILDRYSLAQVVKGTLRKLRRDGLPVPFSNLRSPRPRGRGGINLLPGRLEE
jgi:Rrf2 family protein